jgi:hypothetical protein
MVNKELLDYIKSVRSKGYDDFAIKANLQKYNYPEKLISEAFSELALLELPKSEVSSKPEVLPKQTPIKAAPKKASSNAFSDSAWLLEETTEASHDSSKSKEINLAEPSKEKKPLNKKTLFTILIPVSVLILLIGIFSLFYFTGNLDLPLSFIGVSSPACNQISVGILKTDSEQLLCIYPDNSQVQLIIENNGNEIISSAQIKFIGEKSSYLNELNDVNLEPTYTLSRVLKYDFAGLGNLKQVSIYPSIEKGSLLQKCYSKKMDYKDIKVC